MSEIYGLLFHAVLQEWDPLDHQRFPGGVAVPRAGTWGSALLPGVTREMLFQLLVHFPVNKHGRKHRTRVVWQIL